MVSKIFAVVVSLFTVFSFSAFAAPTAILGLSPASHAFGNHNVGAFATQVVTVKNTGTKIATAISITGASAPFSFAASTCGPVLGIGASCAFTVKFAPTAAGNFTDTIFTKYNNGVTTVTVNFAVSGHGVAIPVPPAVLSISNAPTFNYGLVNVGAISDHVFTVTNVGGQKATAVSASAGGAYSVVANACGALILKGAACNITVRFKPLVVGVASSALSVSFFNGSSSQVSARGVTGIGKLPPPPPPSPAFFTLTGAPLFHFGSHAVGSSVSHIFTLKNVGASVGKMVSINVGAPFLVQANTCGINVVPGASCKITLGFAPVTAGVFNSPFQVTYFNGVVNKIAAMNVDGSAVGASALSYVGGSFFDYGPVKLGTFAQRTFTLHNSGSGPANALVFNSASPFNIVGKTCGVTLPAGASCNITVRFTPLLVGSIGISVQATFFDIGGAKSMLLKLKGTGIALASLGFTAAPTFDFGSVPAGTSRIRSLTLTNFGGGAALMQTVSVGAPYFISASSCGAVLPPGFSCTLAVVFAPSVAGPSSSTLTAGYFDGSVARTAAVGVMGFAVEPATLILSDAPVFDFGTVAAGASALHSVTVSNFGQVGATITGVAIASPFDVAASGCSGFLSAGASCSLSMRFRPTAGGDFADTLTVSYSDGVNPRATTRVVRGSGSTPARLVFAEGTTFDFGATAVGASASRTLTLMNVGQSVAKNMQAPHTNAPYVVSNTDCGTSLAIGANCSVTVDFAPSAAGAFPDALALTYSDGLNVRTVSIALLGSGGSSVGFDGAALATSLTDSGMYVGGDFSTYRGLAANRIARLSPNGALDSSFNVGSGFDATVRAIATIPSSTDIYVGGSFTKFNGNAVSRFVRLRADGSLAARFDFDNDVRAIVVDSTGRAYVGGEMLVRLNADGTLDTTFNAPAGLNGRVNVIALEADGRIAIGGNFTKTVDDGGAVMGYNRFARLRSDGSPDVNGNGFDGEVFALATDSDGALYVGGEFKGYQGSDVNSVAKLNADGTLATYTLPATFTGRVSAIVVANGAVSLGGNFGNGNVLRTDGAGNVDASFAFGLGVEDAVSALAAVGDGGLLIAGRFTTYDAATVNRLVVVDRLGKRVLP